MKWNDDTLTKPVASLPMYDWPETGPALDRLWTKIRSKLNQAGLDAPEYLTRIDTPPVLWTSPELLLGQTCGWPYANRLRGQVEPIARFSHYLENCPDGYYYSVFIGNKDTPSCILASPEQFNQIEMVAVNEKNSQSGFHVLREITHEYSDKAIDAERRLITGSHRNSVRAVAEGEAQFAAIDAISFQLAKRYEPEYASKVTVLGSSQPKPGLPLITSKQNTHLIPTILEAVAYGAYNLSNKDKTTLLLKGITPAKDSDYDVFQ